MTTEDYIKGVLASDTVVLSKVISLLESRLSSDRATALKVLEAIHSHTGDAIRIGITGAPGVGKSTFIEALGLHLIDLGKKVAVLTVDPSSPLSKGSILGDKTRMERLSRAAHAFIRPSAAGSSLGGVTHHTRESMLMCEAAGYDVIIIETVGVGQSEVMVRDMVDFFLLLMMAGAGDELQGIKKGIVEIADALVITKSDGENIARTKESQSIFRNALHMLSAHNPYWQPPVLTCSAQQNEGIKEVWDTISQFIQEMQKKDFMEDQRRQQRVKWMHECLRTGLEIFLEQHQESLNIETLGKQVASGKILPITAANTILSHALKL